MIKRLLFLGLTALSPHFLFAQVGINTSSPNSTLHVNGTIASNYLNSRTFQNTNEAYYVGINNHYFVFDGDKDGTLELKNESGPIGRVYRVKNASAFKLTVFPETSTNTLRVNNLINQPNYVVSPGDYIEVIRTKASGTNTWDISYVAKGITNEDTNITLYGAKLSVPPLRVGISNAYSTNTNTLNSNDLSIFPRWDYTNSTIIENADNAAYSTGIGTDRWVLIKKELPPRVNNLNPNNDITRNIFATTRASNDNSYFVSNIKPSRVILTYEYIGTPFTNINNIRPLITAGNNLDQKTVLQASILSFNNVTTLNGLRTRLTVVVSRLDLIGRTGSSDYAGSDWRENTSFINLLIVN